MFTLSIGPTERVQQVIGAMYRCMYPYLISIYLSISGGSLRMAPMQYTPGSTLVQTI